MKSTKNKCIVISNPIPATNASPKVTLEKFARLLGSVYSHVTVICGNVQRMSIPSNAQLVSVKCERKGSKARRVISFALCEIRSSMRIIGCSSKGDDAFFWIGDKMVIPFICAKAKGLTTYYMIAGNIGREGKGSSWGAWLIRLMAQQADFVFAEAASVFDEWDLNLAKRKKLCLHLYVDLPEAVHVKSEVQVVGMLCRLTPGKHVVDSIRAVHRMNRFCANDVKLQIVGDGPQRVECERLVKDLGAEECIDIVGWVDHEKALSYIEGWDLLLFPSDAEGLPNSPLESMARGIPVLASRVGGLRDLIEEGVNGWFLEGTDPEQIRTALEEIVRKSPKEVEEVSRKARLTIEGRYSFAGAVDNASNQLGKGRGCC